MTKSVSRWAVVVALSLAAGTVIVPTRHTLAQDEKSADPQPKQAVAAVQAQPQPAPSVVTSVTPEQVATVEQLKLEAFSALKSGKFQQSNELLQKAASLSPDPSVRQMSTWLGQFETQRRRPSDDIVEVLHEAPGIRVLHTGSHDDATQGAAIGRLP